MEKIKQLNKEFSELVGIKKVQAFIINTESDEIRYYSYPSGKYKKPKGWEKSLAVSLPEPIYPDFTSSENFTKLINIQWNMFGNVGSQYNKLENESFQVNYLSTKIAAIKVARSLGGGAMLEKYIERVCNTDFEYPIEEYL